MEDIGTMIHEITDKGRLFFPRRMFNAIVRWILGVYSPSGTVRVINTANPSDERSIGLDVDIEAVTSLVRKSLDARGFTTQQRRDVCGIVRDCLDGVSIYWNDRRASVSEAWLEKFVQNDNQQALPAPDAGTPTALQSGAQPSGGGASEDAGSFTASGSGNGVKFLAVSRSYSNGGVTQLFFREVTVAADGRICNVSGENGSVMVYSV